MADLTSRPDMRDEPALAVAPPREPAAGDGDLPDAAPAPDALLAHESEPREPTTTPSQLRRFIKSRPWVPMHELRRRFGIGGDDDEMTGVDLAGCRIFVGLPPPEAAMLGDLMRQGDVGYELIHDPDCPAIAGVFPMRPVTRP